MMGANWQRQAGNTTQHDRFYSAVKRPVPRKPRWGSSIIRHEDVDDTEHVDREIDAAYEEFHGSKVHFIA